MTAFERIEQLIAEVHGEEDISDVCDDILKLLTIPPMNVGPHQVNRHGMGPMSRGPPKQCDFDFMHRIFNHGFAYNHSDDSDDEAPAPVNDGPNDLSAGRAGGRLVLIFVVCAVAVVVVAVTRLHTSPPVHTSCLHTGGRSAARAPAPLHFIRN